MYIDIYIVIWFECNQRHQDDGDGFPKLDGKSGNPETWG